MKFLEQTNYNYNKLTDLIEYHKIDNFIKLFVGNTNGKLFADIGSGLCNYVEYLKNRYSELNIHCIDINPRLSELAKSKGFDAINGSVLDIPYKSETFDIVHCSHVIEHLPYPQVIKALDELFRIVKKDGYVIIKSPLIINHRFYNDIDHVRPYPPNAILNYFQNQQQQKVGNLKIKEINRWYTRIGYEINYYKYDNRLTRYLNIFFRITWSYLRFPYARPNNYGIIFQKLS